MITWNEVWPMLLIAGLVAAYAIKAHGWNRRGELGKSAVGGLVLVAAFFGYLFFWL